jgi:hypothetical protein
VTEPNLPDGLPIEPPLTPPSTVAPPTTSGYSAPSMPDITDLVEGSKGRERTSSGGGLSRGLLAGAIVGGLVLLLVGFVVGQARAAGPKSLAEAVQQASAGDLPCGAPAAGAGQGGGAGGAGFLTRLCSASGGPGVPNGGAGGGQGGAGGFGGGGFGRGVSGTVKSVSNGSMTVTTRAGDVTVIVPNGVTVDKTVSGSLSDVTAGSTVTVVSTTDSSGNRTASRITIVPAGSLPTGPPGVPGA